MLTGATIAIVKQIFTPKINRSYDCHCKTDIYTLSKRELRLPL
jgi:hypothetical protein